jgi:hypothetical protein
MATAPDSSFQSLANETREYVFREMPSALDEQGEKRVQFEKDFNEHLDKLSIDKSLLAEINPVPFRVVDHLFQCHIQPEGQSRFEYPLKIFNQPKMNVYFIKSVPNAFIFLNNHSPTALFTKRGYLMLVGGHTTNEVISSMALCCVKIMHILKTYYPTKKFTMSNFSIKNKVAVTRFPLYLINRHLMVDSFRNNGIKKTKFSERSINFVFVHELVPFKPSITFCVSASGKINILGFHYNYEADFAMKLFIFLLNKSGALVRCKEPTVENLEEDELLQEKKTKAALTKKAKKKEATKLKWDRLSSELPSSSSSPPQPRKKKLKTSSKPVESHLQASLDPSSEIDSCLDLLLDWPEE